MRTHIASLVLTTALALGFSGPAQADNFIPGHLVAEQVVGNTIEGRYRSCAAPRKDFFEHYKADGTFRGKERDCGMAGNWDTYVGKWTVEDGRFCVYPGSDRQSGCFSYIEGEDGKLVRAGQTVDTVEFIIVEGNPDNL